MDKIKIASGTSLLSDLSIEMYDSALKFYGENYKKVIDDALNITYLYEWNKQSMLDIIRQISGSNIDYKQVANLVKNEKTTLGFHYLSKRFYMGVNHFVVVRNMSDKDEMRATLSHELYGHACCATYNNFVSNDSYICSRNGIILERQATGEILNDKAGEGMIEYIALEIMKIYKPSFKRSSNTYIYNHAVELARQMFKYIGKDKMLELLVLGKGNVEKLFDKDNVYSWRSIELELEKNPSEIDIDENLDGFVKRYRNLNR